MNPAIVTYSPSGMETPSAVSTSSTWVCPSTNQRSWRMRTIVGSSSSSDRDESSDRHVLAFRNGNAERRFDFVDVGLSVDQPTVLADAHDRRLLVFVRSG